jgi:YidC/Oxa1 family membrane protein insertase
MSVFSLFDPAVALVHTGLTTIASGLDPLLGGASVAVALMLVTVVVRACLLPLAVSVLKAERARRALAPELDRLRRRHRQDPARLLSEQQAAYREAGVSPFAGLLPALAQGPALYVIYRLCQLTTIGAGPNVVLTAGLFGAPLSAHLPALLAAGPIGVPILLLAGLLAVAVATSRQQVRRLRATTTGEIAPMSLTVARVLPYGTVLMAAVVPMAVSIYLLTSTTWMLAERAVLPRFF